MSNETLFSEKIFSKWIYKLLLFVFSYLFAALLASGQVGLNILTLFYGPIWFPSGFTWYFEGTKYQYGEGTIIGICAYLIITLSAVVVKHKRPAKILYIIFVILLILNIIGCYNTEPPMF
jgi:hypothetical protein